MTTTIATTTTLEALEQELASLGSPGDVPLTYNAQAEYARKQSALRGRIRTIQVSQRTMQEVEPQLVDLTAWQRHLLGWREEICGARPELPDLLRERQEPNRIMGCIDRVDVPPDATYSQVLSLRVVESGLSALDGSGYMLETLPLGDCMRASGYSETVPPPPGEAGMRLPWFGSLREVETRLKELQTRRDDAATRLERAVQLETV
jgi:hypothetical protein